MAASSRPRERGPVRRVHHLEVHGRRRDGGDRLVRADRGAQARREVEQATVALGDVGDRGRLDVDGQPADVEGGRLGERAAGRRRRPRRWAGTTPPRACRWLWARWMIGARRSRLHHARRWPSGCGRSGCRASGRRPRPWRPRRRRPPTARARRARRSSRTRRPMRRGRCGARRSTRRRPGRAARAPAGRHLVGGDDHHAHDQQRRPPPARRAAAGAPVAVGAVGSRARRRSPPPPPHHIGGAAPDACASRRTLSGRRCGGLASGGEEGAGPAGGEGQPCHRLHLHRAVGAPGRDGRRLHQLELQGQPERRLGEVPALRRRPSASAGPSRRIIGAGEQHGLHAARAGRGAPGRPARARPNGAPARAAPGSRPRRPGRRPPAPTAPATHCSAASSSGPAIGAATAPMPASGTGPKTSAVGTRSAKRRSSP